MVTALGGNHHRLDFMIGPGKALDPEKYFIICTDAIGNGLTTSPSNSKLQPRMQFPETHDVGLGHSKPAEQVRRATVDVVDVEGGDLHRLG
jgi:hypothetical protein